MIAATGLVILLKLDSNCIFFSPCDLIDDFEKWYGTSSLHHQALCIISKSSVNSILSYSTDTSNSCKNCQFFVPCDLEILRMTFKNNRAPLLCCFKRWASFHRQQWILTGYIVRKRPIWVKIVFFPVPPWNFTDDLEINMAPLLCHFMLCAWFQSHH